MLRVLTETEGYVAIEKPEGISSIPGDPRDGESVLAKLQRERGERLWVVHRLDKEVSGVLLFARSAGAHRWACEQFETRAVGKTYVALLHGVPAGERGSIDAPLREYGSGRMGVDATRGKPSHTEWRIVERIRDYTLVEAHPTTGRRHQLRAHFFHIDHAIAGDSRYGDSAQQAKWPRLMLHALSLTMPLPAGCHLTAHSEPPVSFTSVLENLRAD